MDRGSKQIPWRLQCAPLRRRRSAGLDKVYRRDVSPSQNVCDASAEHVEVPNGVVEGSKVRRLAERVYNIRKVSKTLRRGCNGF